MLRKLHKVDNSHYDMPLIYYIKGHSLHFGRPEFALIIDLRFGTISFGLYISGKLKFRNRVFPHKLGLIVTNLDVIGVIEVEETFGKLCDEDSIRLCLLLALEVIFMGRLLTCPVDDILFRLVEMLKLGMLFHRGHSCYYMELMVGLPTIGRAGRCGHHRRFGADIILKIWIELFFGGFVFGGRSGMCSDMGLILLMSGFLDNYLLALLLRLKVLLEGVCYGLSGGSFGLIELR
ncbi:hypothetical protein Tco_0156659 [Tanacetum coccineum]